MTLGGDSLCDHTPRRTTPPADLRPLILSPRSLFAYGSQSPSKAVGDLTFTGDSYNTFPVVRPPSPVPREERLGQGPSGSPDLPRATGGTSLRVLSPSSSGDTSQGNHPTRRHTTLSNPVRSAQYTTVPAQGPRGGTGPPTVLAHRSGKTSSVRPTTSAVGDGSSGEGSGRSHQRSTPYPVDSEEGRGTSQSYPFTSSPGVLRDSHPTPVVVGERSVHR